MSMFRSLTAFRSLAAGLLLAAISGVALACPFCEAPSVTLTEQVGQADAVALVQWVSGSPRDKEKGFVGDTVYEVVEFLKDQSKTIKPGSRITLERYRPAKAGDLFLLLGTLSPDLDWGSPIEISEPTYRYIEKAPSKESDTTTRLTYFMQFLEHSDPLVAGDAYAEFAVAEYKHIVPLSSKFPRDKLRAWLADPKTVPTRLGLYGMMLGLSGQAEDAEFMKNRILEKHDGFRLGIDGLMGGYLLLAKDDGLSVIDKAMFQDKTVPFSDTYAAMQSLRFMWTYGDGAISKDRLRQSMRILLDRPELADIVVTDLARWQDWSVMDRLMEIYVEKEFDVPAIRRNIIRYFLTAEAAKPSGAAATAELPAHVQAAKQHLAALRKQDPKTVKEAEELYYLSF